MPSTRKRFLGFIIDSVAMKFFLPDQKVQKIILACSNLVSEQTPTIRQVDHVTGLLVSAFPAINYLRLYYRFIELCKSQVLSKTNDFEQVMSLSSKALSDLHWVIENLAKNNGCFFFFEPRPINVFIESDARLLGWGASCNSKSAQGRRSMLEISNHINCLELLAAFYGLQAFVADQKDVHVRLKLDNSSAIGYINNMGGTKSTPPNSLA